jgi:hypothetical protein
MNLGLVLFNWLILVPDCYWLITQECNICLIRVKFLTPRKVPPAPVFIGRVGVASVERRLSLLILFTIYKQQRTCSNWIIYQEYLKKNNKCLTKTLKI